MPFTRSPSKFIRSNMDRIRRSLRDSFRKRSNSGSPSERHVAGGNGAGAGDLSKPQLWSQDEATVRAGTCAFSVKYLGSVEVGESRGMQVCEEALKTLRTNRRRPTKGVLYVSGDGLRVVDSENKGLVVDQTIEKVSFCAPDRNHEKGFAYICRDGTTRRWMCHGFHAVKDSGERLSHAVGCAFAVCLERKQKRDREAQQTSSAQQSQASSNNTTPSHGNASIASTATAKSTAAPFQRQSSFKQAPLTERLQDPQNVKPAEVPPVRPAVNPHAVARPHGNRHLFERQGSLRMPQIPLKETSNVDNSAAETNQDMFRRFNSLRLNQLPSNLARYEQSPNTFGQGAILEEDPLHSTDGTLAMFTGATNFYGAQSNSSYFSPPVSELGSPLSQTRSASFDAPLINGQGTYGGGSVDMGTTFAPSTALTGGAGGASGNSRLRGDEWLQTAAKQAKLFQSYRQSPPIAEQTIQEAIPTKSSGAAAPPLFAPPPLPPRQPQPPVPAPAAPPKPMLQYPHARSFDFGRSPPLVDSPARQPQFPVTFEKTPTVEPTAMEFDAKWNALSGTQPRRHSEVAAPGTGAKTMQSSTNPFSQESSSVNI